MLVVGYHHSFSSIINGNPDYIVFSCLILLVINNGWKLPWCIRSPVKCMLAFVQKTLWHIPSLAMKDRLSGSVNNYFYFYLLIFILFTFIYDRRVWSTYWWKRACKRYYYYFYALEPYEEMHIVKSNHMSVHNATTSEYLDLIAIEFESIYPTVLQGFIMCSAVEV